MTFLESLGSPADLRRLDASECDVLAKEIRDYLITTVSGTGGHLGPNLGVVELTMGLHRTFESPRDTASPRRPRLRPPLDGSPPERRRPPRRLVSPLPVTSRRFHGRRIKPLPPSLSPRSLPPLQRMDP